MIESEARQLIGHMAELWTTWKRTDAQIGLWVKLLRPHEYDTALSAIESVWTEKNFGRPDPSAILAKIRAAEPQTESKRGPQVDPYRHGVFVQCVCVGEDGRGRLGRFAPVIAAPCQDFSPDDLVQIAGTWLEMYARQYGGVWEIVQGATVGEMFGRAAVIRAEIARLEQEAEAMEEEANETAEAV